MRYLLTTGHNEPKFYKQDGSIVELELKYIKSRTITSIDEHGRIVSHTVTGLPSNVDIWMVDSVEKALRLLAKHGIYPYSSKSAARANAKRIGLTTFKYISVS
ncbi:hypothetical protein [Rheinheimera hassiensis]|uniref:hypothetical protein n=1 Tax=Rheinheimera hassiensis TaxID=1193627 RepID=UPI001F0625D0|nr:hypothetical protein [Rheinheimera hassiensis]